MVGVFANIFTSFTLGLLTPLTALCVLPLYPGFISYLANRIKKETTRKTLLLLGLLMVAGVISFMLLLGLLFTTILQASLTKIVGIISPIAFGMLIIVSLLLIFNFELNKFFPQIKTPKTKNPLFGSYVMGFFFGAIVLPCNPALIAAFFARAFLITNPVTNVLNFLFFGIGMGAPLLVLSLISTAASQQVIGFLTKHKRIINLSTGIIMLVISVYYLIFVFRIFG
jgi:cytochrome c-type biogenesis protein